jgi:hypothetical protein
MRTLIVVDCEAPFGVGAPSVGDMTEFGAVDARRISRSCGNGHRGPVQRIVRSAVLIVLLEPWTDLEPILGCDRHVALIEQTV